MSIFNKVLGATVGLASLVAVGAQSQPLQKTQLSTASTQTKTVQADNVHYVDQDATGANNGNTWGDAYTTLQDALNEARQTPGDDDIYVAEGTYYPDQGQNTTDDDRNASFNVPSGVNLYGRFNGDEAAPSDRVLDRGANPTTLSGEIQQDNQDNNNAYTVLKLNGGTIDNVRIANGNANGDREQRRGGGIDATSGRIQNTWVQQNRAEQGGGIYITGTTSLENVLVNENQAPTASGLLSMRGASNITSATITDDVTIVDNDPTTTSDDTRITNSVLTGNTEVLTPTQQNVSFDVHEVGEDLYDGGDAPGELDEVQVRVDGKTYTANTTNGTGTITFPTTTLTDNVRVTVDDDDYLGTYMLNKTGTETAPDLTITGPNRTTFPDEPDHQSNYDPETAGPNTGNGTAGNAVNGLANTDIPLTDLESSLEVRVIPTESPEGYDVSSIYAELLSTDRVARWTNLGGFSEVDLNIYDTGQTQSWKDKALNSYETLRNIMPIPLSDEVETLTLSQLQAQFSTRNNQNITYYEVGAPGNNINKDNTNTYAANSVAAASEASAQSTFKSEGISSLVGLETTFTDDGQQLEPMNYIYDSSTDTFNDDATFAVRGVYSMFSNSTLE